MAKIKIIDLNDDNLSSLSDDDILKLFRNIRAAKDNKISNGEIKTKSIPTPTPPIYTEPVKELPGWLAMMRNVGKSTLAVGVMGLLERRVFCCDAQKAERENTCKNCEHREFINEHERCVSFKGGEQGCGCFLEQKRKFAAVRCELGKWDEIDKQYDVPIESPARTPAEVPPG